MLTQLHGDWRSVITRRRYPTANVARQAMLTLQCRSGASKPSPTSTWWWCPIFSNMANDDLSKQWMFDSNLIMFLGSNHVQWWYLAPEIVPDNKLAISIISLSINNISAIVRVETMTAHHSSWLTWLQQSIFFHLAPEMVPQNLKWILPNFGMVSSNRKSGWANRMAVSKFTPEVHK